MKRKKIVFLFVCLLLCLAACGTEPANSAEPTPSAELTNTPVPTISVNPQPVSIIGSVRNYMEERGYSCSRIEQLGDSYLLSGYQLAVLSGTYEKDGKKIERLHLVHLVFENGDYRVLNLYPGNEPTESGIYPNIVNINGRTIIWTALDENQADYPFLRLDFTDGISEHVPVGGAAAVYRLESGQTLSGIVPMREDQTALLQHYFDAEALESVGSITYGNELEIDPMTGEVVAICGYPKAPDEDSKRALTEALLESGMMAQRTNFELLSAKEYSGKVFACIAFTRNGETVYELIVAALTIEGYFDIIGVCEFTPPEETGYRMYSTAVENDIICWTLLNETRSNGGEQVPMDFNAFRFYWDNGETKDDNVMDRFFVYFNRHVPLPTHCVPIVNGNEVTELSGTVTRVNMQAP